MLLVVICRSKIQVYANTTAPLRTVQGMSGLLYTGER